MQEENENQNKQTRFRPLIFALLFLLAFTLLFFLFGKRTIKAQEEENLSYLSGPCIAPPPTGDMCSLKCSPTKEELKMVQTAWNYIKNNTNKSGLVNSADRYTSGATWDWAGAVFGMFTAYKFGIIDEKEFDDRFSNFLNALQKMPLYNNEVPNKTYNVKALKMSDYRNRITPDGIGWSVLDLGRLLSSLRVVQRCMPKYEEDVTKSILRWRFCNLFDEKGTMYGAMLNKKGERYIVQEGLTGYEEYAAKSFDLWGFNADKAKSYADTEFVDIYGIKIPVDKRKNFHNYVVSESYWLQGLEFNFMDKETKEYSRRIHDIQQKRYEDTGIITAISEDNIDRRPYFLYNTIFVNGEKFKTITDKGEDYNHYKSLSTKAGLGMHYLYDTPYSAKVFNALKYAYNEKRGWYSGKYESQAGFNKAITLNTNGIILETMLYSKMGPLHLAGKDLQNTKWDYYRNNVNNFRCLPGDKKFEFLEPKQGNDSSDEILCCEDALSAKLAWEYFEENYNEKTGLVNGMNKFPQVKVEHIGSTIFATISAYKLELIKKDEFAQRITKILATLKKLRLYKYQLPNNTYHAKTGQMVGFSNKPSQKGNGFTITSIAKLLNSLYVLGKIYPYFEKDTNAIVSRFNLYYAIKNNKPISIYFNGKKEFKKPVTDQAWEYYVRNSLKFFNTNIKSDYIDDKFLDYKAIGSYEVPVSFQTQRTNLEPFLWTMLEQPYFLKYKHYMSNMLHVLEEQYMTSGEFSTSSEETSSRKPGFIYNYIYDKGQRFTTRGKDNKSYPKASTISVKTAYILNSLYDTMYTNELVATVNTIKNGSDGWYSGIYNKSTKVNKSINITTNAAVLQALFYKRYGNFYDFIEKPKDKKEKLLKQMQSDLKQKKSEVVQVVEEIMGEQTTTIDKQYIYPSKIEVKIPYNKEYKKAKDAWIKEEIRKAKERQKQKAKKNKKKAEINPLKKTDSLVSLAKKDFSKPFFIGLKNSEKKSKEFKAKLEEKEKLALIEKLEKKKERKLAKQRAKQKSLKEKWAKQKKQKEERLARKANLKSTGEKVSKEKKKLS